MRMLLVCGYFEVGVRKICRCYATNSQDIDEDNWFKLNLESIGLTIEETQVRHADYELEEMSAGHWQPT